MKGRELEKAVRGFLLPHMPGFAYAKRKVYRKPIGDILQGLSFDSSGFQADGFYVNYFSYLLITPVPILTLSHGARTHPPWFDCESANDPRPWGQLLACVRGQAEPSWKKGSTLKRFMRHYRWTRRSPVAYALFERACVQARLGQRRRALASLNRYEKVNDRPDDASWYTRAHSQSLREAIEGDRDHLTLVLEEWRRTSLTKVLGTDAVQGEH